MSSVAFLSAIMKLLVLFSAIALVAGNNAGNLESLLLSTSLLKSSVDSPLKFPVDSNLGSPVDSPLGSPVDSRLGSPVDSNLGSPVNPNLGSPVDSPLGAPVDSPVGTRLESPVETDYHNKVGIQAAQRIRAAEEALDFDGSRIVGGTPAAHGQYPYMGGLVIHLTSGWTSVCGSSLLSNTRAVTAAHCWRTTNNQAQSFTVVLGSLRLYSGGTRVHTSDVETHASYNMFSLINDIAIMRLPSVPFNDHIQPIGLAHGSYLYAGTWAWAAGYGRTRDGLAISEYQYLSQVSVQIITNALCAATYGTNTVRPSTVCAATWGGRGTCGGDSGGPLVAFNEQLGWHLIGVTSFGHVNGCQRNYPIGFARVSTFTDWIWPRM